MRNLIIRSISGIAFILIIICSLFFSPYFYLAAFLFFIVVMLSEYLNITVGKGLSGGKISVYATSVALFVTVWVYYQYGWDLSFILLALLPLLFIFISFLFEKREEDGYEKLPYLVSSIVYIALPFTLTNIIVFRPDGFNGYLLMSMFILLWANDVGAYVFGMLFGQKNGHKLFPSISPKKSWEGFFGGLIVSMSAGFLISYFKFIDLTSVQTICLALIIVCFGTLGDLAESQIKRNFGVKDSGSIMPGHGGLLDRFDGALIAFPASIIYLSLLHLI